MTIKIKRTICRALGAALMFVMLMVVGGMDMGWMPTGRGAVLAITSELLSIALLYKGGVLRP